MQSRLKAASLAVGFVWQAVRRAAPVACLVFAPLLVGGSAWAGTSMNPAPARTGSPWLECKAGSRTFRVVQAARGLHRLTVDNRSNNGLKLEVSPVFFTQTVTFHLVKQGEPILSASFWAEVAEVGSFEIPADKRTQKSPGEYWVNEDDWGPLDTCTLKALPRVTGNS